MNTPCQLDPPACARPCAVASASLAAALLTSCLLSGCLSRPSLIKQSFLFPATAITPTNALSHGPVLGIRVLSVASPFDGQSLLYRTGEFSYERDPYAEFLVPPALALVAPLRGRLRDCGLFSDVSEPGSSLIPSTLVEIYVSSLYGDFREQTAGAAVLGMRFIFLEAPQGVPGRTLLEKDYARRVLLADRTAAALMQGWSSALDQILTEVVADLKTAAPARAADFAPGRKKRAA